MMRTGRLMTGPAGECSCPDATSLLPRAEQ